MAYGEALVMLNREMRSVSHRRMAMAIEMAISIAVILAKDHVMVH